MIWQYYVFTEPENVEDWLNSVGKDGWELVTAVLTPNGMRYFMKRRG